MPPIPNTKQNAQKTVTTADRKVPYLVKARILHVHCRREKTRCTLSSPHPSTGNRAQWRCTKRRLEEDRRGRGKNLQTPHPPGVMDTRIFKKSQMKRSRTAPSSRRRPQIEALIDHASAEWNRTTAMSPEEAYAGLPRLSY
jgi:hypothetical protein